MKLLGEDFGLICICAERYALGRQTYMPSLVQGFIREHISLIETADISVMIDDIDSEMPFMKNYHSLGDPDIDAPGWVEFRNFLIMERARRPQE